MGTPFNASIILAGREPQVNTPFQTMQQGLTVQQLAQSVASQPALTQATLDAQQQQHEIHAQQIQAQKDALESQDKFAKLIQKHQITIPTSLAPTAAPTQSPAALPSSSAKPTENKADDDSADANGDEEAPPGGPSDSGNSPSPSAAPAGDEEAPAQPSTSAESTVSPATAASTAQPSAQKAKGATGPTPTLPTSAQSSPVPPPSATGTSVTTTDYSGAIKEALASGDPRQVALAQQLQQQLNDEAKSNAVALKDQLAARKEVVQQAGALLNGVNQYSNWDNIRSELVKLGFQNVPLKFDAQWVKEKQNAAISREKFIDQEIASTKANLENAEKAPAIIAKRFSDVAGPDSTLQEKQTVLHNMMVQFPNDYDIVSKGMELALHGDKKGLIEMGLTPEQMQKAQENNLPPGTVAQLNQGLQDRFRVLNPGQPLPPMYTLPPNATQKDFDRVDKLLGQTENATATKAQRDTLNAIRNQTAAIATEARSSRADAAVTARSDKSYDRTSSALDKIQAPLDALNMRMGRLNDTITQNTPAANALVAPELLTIMAGGQGSGLRMNEAEIQRVVGGRSKWQSLEAAINQWRLDPSKANSITPEQNEQIKSLVKTVNDKLQTKIGEVNRGRDALLATDDPTDQRKIVNDVRTAHQQIDNGTYKAPVVGAPAQASNAGQAGGLDLSKFDSEAQPKKPTASTVAPAKPVGTAPSTKPPAVAVTTKEQAQALPDGARFTFKGKTYIKQANGLVPE